jgi:hypothetical protein
LKKEAISLVCKLLATKKALQREVSENLQEASLYLEDMPSEKHFGDVVSKSKPSPLEHRKRGCLKIIGVE